MQEVTKEDSRTAIEQVVRENFGKMLAALIHQFGDIALSEDGLQEAILIALDKWSESGPPEQPAGWLLKTAKRKIIDRLRRQKNFQMKSDQIRVLKQIEEESTNLEATMEDNKIPDERLRLIFVCCHPALTDQVKVALTLRTLCGLDTREVASAFLVSEATMAQRLVRAKAKIKIAKIPFEVPPDDLLQERLSAVLSVIYLIYNEGYLKSSGDQLVSGALCEEAIHLALVLLQLMPKQTEVMGLLALLYFHHSRSAARIDGDGRLVNLERQDRSLWNKEYIKRADKVLKTALMIGDLGPYQLEASISGVHAHASAFAETDWQQIVLLYRHLKRIDPNPVIKLNMAVALSFAQDPETALSFLDEVIDPEQLNGYTPYYVAKSDFLHRTNNIKKARKFLEIAIIHCNNQPESQYLQQKLLLLEDIPMICQ